MKLILKLIYLLLCQIIRSSSIYANSTHQGLQEIKKLIDALPDDPEFLEDTLAPVEKKFFEVKPGTNDSEKEG